MADDPVTGILGPSLALTRCTFDPSWLIASRRRSLLFAGCHTNNYDGAPGGGVLSFEVDEQSGELSQIDGRRLDFAHVTHVSLDGSEQFLLCTSSLGGGLSVVALDASGHFGAVSAKVVFTGVPVIPPGSESTAPYYPGTEIPTVLEGYHTQPHCAVFAPDSDFVVACDTAQNMLYLLRFDPMFGQLDLLQALRHPREHAGPRLLAFHPDGEHFFSIDEAGLSVTSYCLLRATEQIRALHSVPLIPEGSTPTPNWQGGGIALHPYGHSLYASIRGHNRIAHVLLDSPEKMRLHELLPTGGNSAVTIALSDDGRFLYCPNTLSDSVTSFAVAERDGSLTRQPSTIGVRSPTHVTFMTRAISGAR